MATRDATGRVALRWEMRVIDRLIGNLKVQTASLSYKNATYSDLQISRGLYISRLEDIGWALPCIQPCIMHFCVEDRAEKIPPFSIGPARTVSCLE